MEFVLAIILVGLIFGIAQLTAGLVLGRWSPMAGGRSELAEPRRAGWLKKLGRRLGRLAIAAEGGLGRQPIAIELPGAEPAAEPASKEEPLAEVVLRTMAKVIETKDRLQDRLSDAEEKLQRQAREIESRINEARTDPLTGLPNRRVFDDELARRIAEWQRKQTTFCLLMADLDRFKVLNDRYGHPAGDAVLREVAEVLRQAFRDMDIVARVGGEEFAVILPNTGSRDARHVTERIRIAVAAAPIKHEESELRVTMSLGLAVVESGDDPASILSRADEGLYASKRSGRNCSHFHNGTRCERITFERDAPGVQADGPAKRCAIATDVDAELSTLCENLRDRLVAVTGDGRRGGREERGTGGEGERGRGGDTLARRA